MSFDTYPSVCLDYLVVCPYPAVPEAIFGVWPWKTIITGVVQCGLDQPRHRFTIRSPWTVARKRVAMFMPPMIVGLAPSARTFCAVVSVAVAIWH